MITGTIKSAVKLQVSDNKWQQKKNNINEKKPVKEMTQEERMLADFKEQACRERESNSHADLYNKLKTGGKLTSEEISYLKQNDPEALRKYREDQVEKEAYERELKNCKTKDEVERVKMNKLGNFATQAKKITTDPYIPLDKKLELMNQLNDKLCRVNQAHLKFMESSQYRDMPTEGELAEERAEESAEKMAEERVEERVDEAYDSDTEAKDVTENSAEYKEKRAQREKEDKPAQSDNIDAGISFEALSDSIGRFVTSVGNLDSSINICL